MTMAMGVGTFLPLLVMRRLVPLSLVEFWFSWSIISLKPSHW